MKGILKKPLGKYARTSITSYSIVIIAYVLMTVLGSAGVQSNSITGQLVPICTYIVLAVSLNLTVGVLGELSLGHAGFMSVGAFTGVVASVSLTNAIPSGPLRLLVAVIIGGIAAGIAGLIIGIPVLRLSGDYLAIVTLAFGEIIKNIVNCLYVGVDEKGLHIGMTSVEALGLSESGRAIIKGPQGAVINQKLASFTAAAILLVVALFVVINLIHSRTGRAITSIRDNQIAAESVGISITRYKLTTFVVSAVLAGMAGVMYALNYSTIAAKKFDFNLSILILVFVVLGGMGNIVGTIIATTVLYMLPELLREFNADKYRMLIYAIVLIAVMLMTNSKGAKAFMARITDYLRALFKGKKGGAENV